VLIVNVPAEVIGVAVAQLSCAESVPKQKTIIRKYIFFIY
jgi:hypothetical protein